MICAQCGDMITGKPIKQLEEYYCSLECANLAAGIDPEEEGYFEEPDVDDFYPAEDE